MPQSSEVEPVERVYLALCLLVNQQLDALASLLDDLLQVKPFQSGFEPLLDVNDVVLLQLRPSQGHGAQVVALGIRALLVYELRHILPQRQLRASLLPYELVLVGRLPVFEQGFVELVLLLQVLRDFQIFLSRLVASIGRLLLLEEAESTLQETQVLHFLLIQVLGCHWVDYLCLHNFVDPSNSSRVRNTLSSVLERLLFYRRGDNFDRRDGVLGGLEQRSLVQIVEVHWSVGLIETAIGFFPILLDLLIETLQRRTV